MTRKTEQSQYGRPQRRPELNVIYFVDSSRTRSIRISLTALKVVVGFSAGVVVWSLASLYLIAVSYSNHFDHERRIRTALSTIFDYQVRYDSVYENAYPNSDRMLNSSKPVAVAEVKSIDGASGGQDKVAPKIAQAKPKPKKAKVKVKPPVKVKKVAVATKEKAVAPKEKDTPPEVKPLVFKEQPKEEVKDEFHVKIEDPRLRVNEGDVNIHFAIRNKNSPKRAEGFVYGVAEFVTAEGARHFVASPSSLVLNDSTGEPENLPDAFRYSIRYYKAKDLAFTPPKGLVGSYDKVRLVVTSKSGVRSSVELSVPENVESADVNGGVR